MKIITFTFLILISILVLPQEALATHEATHCIQVYGGGSVCGTKAPEVVHKPVETDIGDVNFGLFGVALLTISATLFYSSRKLIISKRLEKGVR